MKTKLVLTLFLSFGTCIACSDNLSLSCDPQINDWAEKNISHFTKSDRNELTNLPLNKARAIYRGLTNEHKASLWQLKVEDYIKTEGLIGDEKNSYSQLLQIIPQLYGKGRIEDDTYLAIEVWEQKMREDYNWTDEDLFWSSCTWMTKEEYQKALVLQYRYYGRTTKSGGGPEINDDDEKTECECIWNIGCGGGLSCERLPDPCEVIQDCGILGSSNCKGVCK